MLKNLWKTKYRDGIRADIQKHLPMLFAKSRDSQNPPPVFYILIGLRDKEIIRELQSLLLLDWIKTNASEYSTYQILNFVETFAEKQVPIENFVNTIINRITPSMNKEMVEAMAHMISIQHPEFMRNFLKKFLSIADQDDTFLRAYVQMTGRKGFLMLMQMANPEQMNRIFKTIKK